MAPDVPVRPDERAGRNGTLAALAAGTAVAALAGTIFLVAGGRPEQSIDDRVPQPDVVSVDDRRVRLLGEQEPVADPRWTDFVGELARVLPEPLARAAGEQACLNLRGNAGDAAAVQAVIAVGVPEDEAEWVLDASRRYLCP